MVSGGTTPSREERACDVLTFYAMMRFLSTVSMGEHLETNFSTALQIGFGKATRGVKGLQQVLRK